MTRLSLRELRRGDLPELARWFEDEETRARFGGMLPLEQWFENIRALINQKNYMVISVNKPIGTVGYETYEDKTASISLLVNPDYRNQGYGKAILNKAIRLLDERTDIHAHIEQDNAASVRCFGACGFVPVGIDKDDMLEYVYKNNYAD